MIKIELIFFKIFFCASLQHKTSFLSESAFSTLINGQNSVILKPRFYVTDKYREILHNTMDLAAFDLSYDGILDNLTQN